MGFTLNHRRKLLLIWNIDGILEVAELLSSKGMKGTFYVPIHSQCNFVLSKSHGTSPACGHRCDRRTRKKSEHDVALPIAIRSSRITRHASGRSLTGCGKSLNRDDSPPQGLKPSPVLHDLRGAKAPLYHSAAGFRDFFRSLLGNRTKN